MCFFLIIVVQQPAVGVCQQLAMGVRPGNLVSREDAGVLGILPHATSEDPHEVGVVTNKGIFASQDSHESAKYNLNN